jgi:putative tryptophan/tyrosine transport system substrate-binding protein
MAVVWPAMRVEANTAPPIRIVALVSPGSKPASGLDAPNLLAFRKGLREAGPQPEHSTRLIVRWAAGDMRLARRHIEEVIEANAEVLVTPSFPISEAAASLTRKIPIVTISSDPVGTGLVASLAKPAGNVTGLSYMTPELNAKRLELLKYAVPDLRRVAVLLNPKNRHEQLGLAETQAAARMLGLEIILVEIETADDLDGAFARIESARPDALLPSENPVTATHFRRMIEFGNRIGLPIMFELTDFAGSGAFMAYGPSYRELFQRAGAIAGRLLRGSSPADLPIEQPTGFELALNLKTARALGLTFPSSLLVRAADVIE